MEALSGFYNRRGRNVALSLGLVVSGGYLAVQYARTRFTELQQRNLEEKATVDQFVTVFCLGIGRDLTHSSAAYNDALNRHKMTAISQSKRYYPRFRNSSWTSLMLKS